jgi:erythritol transport system permease protein
MSTSKAAVLPRAKRPSTTALQILVTARAFVALLIVFAVFTILSPGFIQPANIEILARQTAINAILAIGMTFVILTGGIDLSVGSIVGLTAMIAGGLINEGIALGALGVVVYPHTWTILVISLAAGALIGLVNGVIITRFQVPPFIATLGMLYVARGLAGLRNDGRTFPNLVGRPELGNTGFEQLGAGTFIGLSYSIWLMVIVAAVAYVIATRTPLGKHVYATGGNERAAELSGVPIRRTKITAYVISGACAALVGLIIASQLVAAHPATGAAFELNAIAAVVLGGTSLAGGRGTMVGTLIGAFVIGVVNVGLTQLGVSSFWQLIVTGAVIVLAVVIDQLQARLQDRIALQQQQQQGGDSPATTPATS